MPQTRFISNIVPGHVLVWLVAYELAVLEKRAVPEMPHEVCAWFAGNGVTRFGKARVEEAPPAEVVTPLEVAAALKSYSCEVCEAQFTRKRRARFCSVACQVAAWRKQARPYGDAALRF
jgi:hypothetical protein